MGTDNSTVEAAAPVAVIAEVVLETAQSPEVGRMQQQLLILKQEEQEVGAGVTTTGTRTFGVAAAAGVMQVLLATAITVGSFSLLTMRILMGLSRSEDPTM